MSWLSMGTISRDYLLPSDQLHTTKSSCLTRELETKSEVDKQLLTDYQYFISLYITTLQDDGVEYERPKHSGGGSC